MDIWSEAVNLWEWLPALAASEQISWTLHCSLWNRITSFLQWSSVVFHFLLEHSYLINSLLIMYFMNVYVFRSLSLVHECSCRTKQHMHKTQTSWTNYKCRNWSIGEALNNIWEIPIDAQFPTSNHIITHKKQTEKYLLILLAYIQYRLWQTLWVVESLVFHSSENQNSTSCWLFLYHSFTNKLDSRVSPNSTKCFIILLLVYVSTISVTRLERRIREIRQF